MMKNLEGLANNPQASTIVWFRQDLRTQDNPALNQAIDSGAVVIPVFIHAVDDENDWPLGAASKWWLHHSLIALSKRLDALGMTLIVRQAKHSLDALQELIADSGATSVVWNRRYEPALVARDQKIKSALRTLGASVESFNSDLWIEPWQIATDQGAPYRVFTPFWRKLKTRLNDLTPQSLARYRGIQPSFHSVVIDDLKLLPRIGWDKAFYEHWQPGELGASAALNEFLDGDVGGYSVARDVPSMASTSRLSPHLAFGEIGPRQILAQCFAKLSQHFADPFSRVEPFLREIAWREFSKHLLFHFPHTTNSNLNARFQHFDWRNPEQDQVAALQLKAWQHGRTGVPIVDAGMRELWQTGWMHNRVRMIVASFLTKNLRLHWLHGARWFWDTLLDADLANNTQGWQWTAGTGADAAPYFRIFNPVSQGERFDPDGLYVRQWVPELQTIPNRWIHQPWMAPAAIRNQFDQAALGYPQPIVDLSLSRAAALTAFANLKG